MPRPISMHRKLIIWFAAGFALAGGYAFAQVVSNADLDTGAGSALRVVKGILLPGNGGPTLVGAGANGDPLPVDVEASVLPAGAATEATLATRASEATLATRATEATLATRGSEATLVTLGTQATLATRASEATLATRASEATLAARASEATLTTLATQVTAAAIAVSAASIDGKIPASPATDRTLATAPFGVRLSDGATFVEPGAPLMNPVGLTRISPVVSNGVTPVNLIAASGATTVYPTFLLCTNEAAATTYTVEILSSVGPVVLLRVRLGAGASFIYDGRGDVRTDASSGLQFRLGGVGADVYCSGAGIQR